VKRECRRGWFGAVFGAVAGLLGLTPKAPAAGYWPTHNCPSCGTLVTRIWRYGPRPGQHYHRHGSTYWYH
jgi:hypothetical protein